MNSTVHSCTHCGKQFVRPIYPSDKGCRKTGKYCSSCSKSRPWLKKNAWQRRDKVKWLRTQLVAIDPGFYLWCALWCSQPFKCAHCGAKEFDEFLYIDRKHKAKCFCGQQCFDSYEDKRRLYARSMAHANRHRNSDLSCKDCGVEYCALPGHRRQVQCLACKEQARLRRQNIKIVRCNIAFRIKKLFKGKSLTTRQQQAIYFCRARLHSLPSRPAEDYELDHLVPVKYFDLTDPIEICLCWHPANLRWIHKLHNNRRGANISAQDMMNMNNVQRRILLGSAF